MGLVLDIGGEEAVAAVQVVAVAEVAGHRLHHVRHSRKSGLTHIQREACTREREDRLYADPDPAFLGNADRGPMSKSKFCSEVQIKFD